MVLRYFLFLLAAYIVFHKIFPFGLFRTRLADMTGADLLLLIARSLVATIGAAYFVVTGFIQPALHDRDRLWCERWTGLAFGVIAIAVGSVLISILEKRDHSNRGPLGRELHFVAAVLALRFLHPLEASLRFRTPQPTRSQGRMDRRGRSCPPGRVQCRVWRSKCTVSSGGDARANFTLSSPMRKIHQAPFTCLEPDRELFNPSWMLLDLVMSKKNAADIRIDPIHSRAICDEIGERLRQVLKRESVGLPPRLQLLVDRLAELDGAAAPSIVPSFEDMLPRRELHSSSA